MGKRNVDRPRLLVVSLSSEGEKWEILHQAPLLKDAGLNPRVYIINPDLSARERTRGKQLREELARLKANGETNLIIRRGRIVKRNSSETSSSEPSKQDERNSKHDQGHTSPLKSQATVQVSLNHKLETTSSEHKTSIPEDNRRA